VDGNGLFKTQACGASHTAVELRQQDGKSENCEQGEQPMQSNPYQSLVSLLSNVSEAYTTALFLVNDKKRELNLVAAQSLSKYLAENIALPLEQSGILSQVHKIGQTIHLDKMQESGSGIPSMLPFYRDGESHIKGLFAVPVGDGAGVLYVDTKYSWGFNDKQQKLIKEIAGVLNDLLQRQESLTQKSHYGRILELWRRVDQAALEEHAIEDLCKQVLTECSQFLETEYGFLAAKEPRKHHYRLLATTANVPRSLTSQRLLVKQGLMGWIFQNQKNLLIPRLNPQTSDHFLFLPSEGLPHHGTFWGLPVRSSLGHRFVLAFLSRAVIEWSGDEQYAVSHALQFFHLILDRFYCLEACDHMQTFDLATGLFNAPTFEARLEEVLAASMQNSTPFTMALIQFEPWQVLSTKAAPKQVREWQADLASSLYEIMPRDAFIGQIAENRFGVLFPGITAPDADHHLALLHGLNQRTSVAKQAGRNKLHPFVASVGFPQDATRSEEIWPLAYRRLFAAFHQKSEKSST
jgi:GGDEF domain-containing protein